jgi:DNA-binding CsgD family transcriptional regulator
MDAAHHFESAVSRLYESVLDSSQWLGALQLIAKCAEGSRAARFRFHLKTGAVWDFSAVGYQQLAQDQYVAHYATLDPGWPIAVASRVGEWHGDDEMLDLKARSQQEFIRDWALPNGLGRLCGAKLLSGPESAIYLSVHREPGAPRFGQRGRDAFNRLMPHLLRAERLRERIGSLSDEVAVARATLDQFGAATFAVDAQCRLRAANRQAETLFAVADSVAVQHGKVCLRSATLSNQLVEAVRQAMPPLLRGSAFVVPGTIRTSHLQVLVLPLSAGVELARLADTALALVVVADPMANAMGRRLFAALYSLTDTEASLATSIAEGVTVKEWADSRGVAISTARTHLASVFHKTGASTQAKLVSLVRAMPLGAVQARHPKVP